MKPAPFDYVRAVSLADACERLRRDGDDVRLIAGGQSLVPMMAMRLTRPRLLVDINEIPALKFVAVEADVVRTGACARQCIIERDDALAAQAPLLRQALAWVGHAQTRNRGTVGGSIAHADPAAELPLVAQVLDASIVLRCATGARTVPAAGYFTGPLTTAGRVDECLEEIHWPVWAEERTGSAFVEVSRRHGDFALVAAAAQVALDADGRCVRASFGLAGGSSTPLAFPDIAGNLVGTRMDEAPLESAGRDAAARFDAAGDVHASTDYRRHLAAVLTSRVLRSAYERAAGERAPSGKPSGPSRPPRTPCRTINF
jgi:CO/xanthine dehydrogenase FAD-binding subunit